jgi:NAD(P)-dependent dehydrogenase (short-subunit alcohol dehydrogenase family)
MNIILKTVILQLYWYLVVLYGSSETYPVSLLLSLVVVFINWTIFKPSIDSVKYLLILLTFILWGFIQDFLLIKFGVLLVDDFPYWMTSLWIAFLCYYGDIFNKFKVINPLVNALLGGLGGLSSYIAGVKISGVEIQYGSELLFYGFVFISWALLFPVTIYLFYKKSFLDRLLDLSIYFSFDQSGFRRHKRFFNKLDDRDIKGENILVTGGTSGIGLSTAISLNKRGANVYVTGRNVEKGKNVEKDGLTFLQLDLTNWDDVKNFINTDITFDHLILNAGGMPKRKELNEQGVESQVASQLLGHYQLVQHLKEANKLSHEARIVWVSSGGMYFKKLIVEQLIDNMNYDKVDTYANVKRAQVTLVEELAKDNKWKGYHHYCMHPGWVDTVGIEEALPKFYNWVKGRLRNGEEGADTIIWLITNKVNFLDNGGFYFDREKVRPYFSSKYNPSSAVRKHLLDYINNLNL